MAEPTPPVPLPDGDGVAYVTDSVGRRLEVRYMTSDQVRAYAAQQVAAERERCAWIVENHNCGSSYYIRPSLAAAIRATLPATEKPAP